METLLSSVVSNIFTEHFEYMAIARLKVKIYG